MGSYILHSLDPATHDFHFYSIHHGSETQPFVRAHGVSEDATNASNTNYPVDEIESHTNLTVAREHRTRRTSVSELRRHEEQKTRAKQRAALAFRRHVYRHHLPAKYVASNKYTRYQPYPGPSGFRANPVYARLLSAFLQRELQVWPHLDIGFLSYYIPALLSHLDVTSDAFLERLTEWIGNERDARLLAHEMELFIRSGRGGLGLDHYDTNPWLQYDPS